MVYTAAAGVYPNQLLPISVDVGCNVGEVRDQPLYMGLQQVSPCFCTIVMLNDVHAHQWSSPGRFEFLLGW